MEKLSEMKVKHNHTLTDIIKVLIFFIFLMLPMITYLPNALYYGFNEHAQAQESNAQITTETTTTNAIYYENGTTKPTDNNEIELNKMYVWDSRKVTSYPSFSGSVECDYLEVIDSENATINNSLNDERVTYLLTLSVYTGQKQYTINVNNGYLVIAFMPKQAPYNFTNYYEGVEILNFNILQNTTQTTTTETTTQTHTMDISKSMQLAWTDMWETPMYNWIDNNTFKFTINAFTTIFNISQESYIANYLTYILTITCIYVIFDVVITLFTKLTHLISAK